MVGGIEALVHSLADVTTELGVDIALSSQVDALLQTDGGYSVQTTQQTIFHTRSVVVNADASHLKESLLSPQHVKHIYIPKPYSMSGWTAIYEVLIDENTPRVGHTVLFQRTISKSFSISLIETNSLRTPQSIFVHNIAAIEQESYTNKSKYRSSICDGQRTS
jgi:phytoene dehydrogenase-like protein